MLNMVNTTVIEEIELFVEVVRIHRQPNQSIGVAEIENLAKIVTGPDPDTLPGWSRLVKSHCTIPREDTVELHFKEGSKHMH